MSLRTRTILLLAVIFTVFLFSLSYAMKKEDEKNCTDCHKKITKQFKGKHKHIPLKDKNCYACHQFHEYRNKTEMKGHLKEVCTECHDAILEGLEEEQIHYPILDDNSCSECHLPHASDFEVLLKTGEKTEICFNCHDEPKKDSKHNHLPYGEKKCLNCHNPHGSFFPSFLNLPPGYLCLDCHTNIIEGYQPNEMHSGTDLNSCEQCHNPHYSKNNKLLHQEGMDLCLNCHKDLGNDLKNKKKHSVLEDDDCLTCHKPHFKKDSPSTEEEQPALCFMCHSDIEEKLELEFAHAAVLDDVCTSCHNPHAGVLNDPESDLCTMCHDIEDENFLGKHAQMPPKKCSICHDPHGSANEKLILTNYHPPFADGDCETCHEAGTTIKELHSIDLCLMCHEVENTGKHHEKVKSGQKCIECHSPHASNKEFLLLPSYLSK